MKILIALALVFAASSAHAESRSEALLKLPLVNSLQSILETKNGERCESPAESDIHWMCTGLIAPVKKARIDATGCGFALELRCPGQKATIYGWVKHYFLNTPRPNDVLPTAEKIIVQDVKIETR